MRAPVSLLFAAALVLADDGRKEKPVFDVPEEKGEKPPVAAREEDPDPIRATVKHLAGWPSDSAQRAAERLIVLKEISTDVVRRILLSTRREDAPLKPGAAFVLGHVGAAQDFLALILAAAEPDQQGDAGTFLEAAYRLDPERAVQESFRFFSLSATKLRREAAGFVRARVTKENLPAVLELLDPKKTPKPFAREIGLDLLDRLVEGREVPWEEAGPRFYEALGDAASQVGRRAMLLLASREDEANVRRLNELVREDPGYWRRRGYAILALSVMSGAYKVQTLEPATLEVLKGDRGLRHRKEPLLRAASALALAQVGLRSSDPECVKLLDREIPIVLIDSVGASDRHYIDFASVMPLAYGMLRRITGKAFPDEAPVWAQWWQDQGHRFRAQRELVAIDEKDLDETTVECTLPGRAPVRFSVVTQQPPAYLHGKALAVSREEMASIVDLLRGEGFFSIAEADAARTEEGALVVVVRVGDLNRTGAFGGADAAAAVRRDRIASRLGETMHGYRWQRLWDIDAQPSWPLFFAENARWFREHPSGPERDARLRAMAAGALNDLVDVRDRLDVVEMIRALPGGGAALSREEAASFCRAVAAEREANEFVSAAVDLLVPAAGEEVGLSLVEALADKVGPSELKLLSRICRSLGVERTGALLGDTRWKVRRAAAAALAEADFKRARPALLRCLEDEEPFVRLTAAEALARRKDAAFLPAVRAIAGDPQMDVRAGVAYALGLLGDVEALEAIDPLLHGDPTADVRLRAVEGLVEGGADGATDRLLRVLERESDVRVRGAAANAVVRLESPALVDRLIERLQLTPAQSPERVALVYILARFRSPKTNEILRAALEGDDPPSASAAALGLARRGDPAALTQLISMLVDGTNGRTAMLHLQMLTSRAFEVPEFRDQAENYKNWNLASTGGNPRTWFVEALAERGYETAPLASWAAGKALDDAAVPVLLRALRDGAWFIRRNACVALASRHGPDAPEEITYNSTDAEAERTIRAYHDWWLREEEARKARERG